MPLVTAQQFQQPSVLGAVGQGLQNRQFMQQQDRLSQADANRQRLQQLAEEQGAQQQFEKGQQLETLQRGVGLPQQGREVDTQEQALMRAFTENPEQAKKVLDDVGIFDSRQREEAAAFADVALGATSEEDVQFAIDERVRKLGVEGRDSKETLLLKDLPLEQRTIALKTLKAAALTAQQRESAALAREGTAARKDSLKTEGKPKVQSSVILPTGDVQVVLSDKTTEVISPGDVAKETVRQAKIFGAELQGLRGAEREAAKNAQKVSLDYFKQLEPISKNISNLNEGIRLIDAGAETGAVAKHFPSIREASVKLKNLQGQLGLDVLRTTTFGALSAAELKFALDTAIPLGLEGEPLKEWLRDKRDAQIKLSNYMSEAANFLGTPGNTISDFMSQKKAAQQATEQQPPKRFKFNPNTGAIE